MLFRSNATYVYQSLHDMGWSKNAICAVLGNADYESNGINPGQWQGANGTGPAFGIVQWDPASKYRNWSSSNGYAYDSLEGQIRFLVESMQPGKGEWLPNHSSVPSGYSMTYNEFIKSTSSVTYLTGVFLYCYERAGVAALQTRIDRAEYWQLEYFS